MHRLLYVVLLLIATASPISAAPAPHRVVTQYCGDRVCGYVDQAPGRKVVRNVKGGKRTVVFCGMGDDLFCGGMRAYARKVGGEVRYWWNWRTVAAEIIVQRPRVVKLAGHSCGGSAAVYVAEAIKPHGIRVARLAVFDGATGFCDTRKAPSNVAAVWSTQQNVGLGGAYMRDRTGRVRETTRHDLGHIGLGFNAGIQNDAAAFFR